MKKYLALLFIMALGFMSNAQTAATATGSKKHKKHVVVKKKEEKVVINNSNSKTVIEIKNDKIYVDGEVVSSIKNANSEDHKIVINHKGKSHGQNSNKEAWERREKKEKPELKEEMEKPERDEQETLDGKSNSFDRMLPNPDRSNDDHYALLGVYTNTNAPVDGAYISGLMHNSPAENAGLTTGDVVTKVNETPVNSSDALVTIIHHSQPGDNLIVTYSRNGNTEQTNVTLTDKRSFDENADMRQMSADNWRNTQQLPNNEGNSNINNDREEMHNDRGEYQRRFRGPHPVRLGISATDGRRPHGVFLDEVKPGSPAEAAGLQKGDIITRINGERVRYAYEMQMLLSYPGIGNIIDIDYRHAGEKMRTEVHIDENRDEREQHDPRFDR